MLCIWISNRPEVSLAPAVSLGYHSEFICGFALLCFMEAARNTEVNTERERVKRRETRLPFKWQLVCMMDAHGYNLTERVYPCMCGVETWLSCLSVCKCVFRCVFACSSNKVCMISSTAKCLWQVEEITGVLQEECEFLHCAVFIYLSGEGEMF